VPEECGREVRVDGDADGTVPSAATPGGSFPELQSPGSALGGFSAVPGVGSESEWGALPGTVPEPWFKGAHGGRRLGGLEPGVEPDLAGVPSGCCRAWLVGAAVSGPALPDWPDVEV
jgi:hypothetical protein